MANYSKAGAGCAQIPAFVVEKVEAGDPRRIRYGCSVPGLTRLASDAPTDFRAQI